MSYVYRRTEGNCYTVGFYDPEGHWQPESDHADPQTAALRVNFLNGGHQLERKTFEQQLVDFVEAVKARSDFRRSAILSEICRVLGDLKVNRASIDENRICAAFKEKGVFND